MYSLLLVEELLLQVLLKQESCKTGDAVDIVGLSEEKLSSTVTGVEMFRKILDEGRAGENVVCF